MESKTPPPSKSHGALWLRLGLDLHITCTQTNYRCLTTQVTCGLQVTIFLTNAMEMSRHLDWLIQVGQRM